MSIAVHPYTKLMTDQEIMVLQILHGMLESDGVKTRDEFTDLMKAAFQNGKLDSKRLADDLGYSPSTVYRWVEGLSAPHPSLWPRIVEWIMRMIEARVQQHAAAAACAGLAN